MRALIVLFFLFSFFEFNYAQTDSLYFNGRDGKTYPNGIDEIIKITFSSISSVRENQSNQKSILDLKSFPNPANKSTKFSFELIKAGNVQIKIYNIQGIEVNSIEIKKCTLGENVIEWDCKDFNKKQVDNGIYIYEIIFGDIHITKKMIIID